MIFASLFLFLGFGEDLLSRLQRFQAKTDEIRKPVEVPLTPYQKALARSIKNNTVLVIGVRCEPPQGDWESVKVEEWPWGGPGAFLVWSRGGKTIPDPRQKAMIFRPLVSGNC